MPWAAYRVAAQGNDSKRTNGGNPEQILECGLLHVPLPYMCCEKDIAEQL